MTPQVQKAPFTVYNASAGSGKTYTLVKNYLKILLNTTNPFQFQQILAMTFTNKAAAEMKFRVLEMLQDFSDNNSENNMFQEIKTDLNLSEKILRQRAENILKSILNNYAGFNITTIDSFTYRLIKSFAFDLGLSLNFEVEMDATLILNEAIDSLLSKLGKDKNLTDTLINFSKEKANDDKDWDVTKELQNISKLLLNEEDILHLSKLKDKKITDFKQLDKLLFNRIKNFEKEWKQIAKDAFKSIEQTNLVKADFVRGGFYSFFEKLLKLDFKTLNFNGTLEKNIQKDHHQCSGKASASAKAEMATIKDKLIELYQKSKQFYAEKYPDYVLDKLVKKSLIPLSVLKYIQKDLDEIKDDNNIKFNSEFNQIISKHLSEQPAPFIYEKIGEKFRHYFIDEMQDTSVLQWKNSIPLIKNALESENEKGENGTLLLVGDAKQSIYRWRGSNPEQFIGLTKNENPFFVTKEIKTLGTNYRSHKNIIDFNNHFFTHIASYLGNLDYSKLYQNGNKQLFNSKKGGYVAISFLEGIKNKEDRDIEYPKKIEEILKNLEGKFHKNEICILTRKRNQGVTIANYLSERGIDVISSETLLIENSPKVQFIINILQIIVQPKDKLAKFEILNFLYNHNRIKQDKHTFFENHVHLNNFEFFKKLKEIDILFDYINFIHLPFYESIETIIRNFNLTKKSDAYVQFFLDIVLEYSYKKNTGLTDFLTYWDEKKDSLSIVVPQGKDAVQIMTIHKSKGLEFPVVIFAYDLDIYYTLNTEKTWFDGLNPSNFNQFTTSLVAYNKNQLQATGKAGQDIVKSKTDALELDNFNLLYVALTRAKEQLFILSEENKPKDKLKNYSHFFQDFLSDNTNFTKQDNSFIFGDSNRESDIVKNPILTETQQGFISSPWQEHQITIVTNSSLDTTFKDARKYGTLLHEILSKIDCKNDVHLVLNSFLNKGLIPVEEKENIKNILLNIVTHPKLEKYFTTEYESYNEREILTEDKHIIIPDKIAVKNNLATIIDYKTGAKEASHKIQINHYADILSKMNFKIQNKILVYINNQTVEPVYF